MTTPQMSDPVRRWARRTQCAWCKEILSDPWPDAGENQEITHGVCEACMDRLLLQVGTDLPTLLDSLEEPVLVLDRENRVRLVNQVASELMEVDQVGDGTRTAGMVFECVHAREPEGCGHTIHCSGCAIRRAIQTTATTGKGVHRLPAKLRQEDRDVQLLITTEKTGEMILLRIDEKESA